MGAYLKHTPGPWEAEMFPTTQGYPIRGGTMPLRAGDRVIAIAMDQGSAPAGESRANSYLIAAAPDLAKALENAVADLLAMSNARWSEYEGTDEELVGEYRAALAKARGEQP